MFEKVARSLNLAASRFYALLERVRPRSRTAFLLWLGAVYLALLVVADFLVFPARKDEIHFWDSAIFFATEFPPTIEQLRSYHEIIAPGCFILWGQLERWLAGGIAGPRALNFVASFAIVCLIGIGRKQRDPDAMLAAFGLFVYPYFLAMSVHLYTDILAAFFVLLGLWSCARDRYLAGALLFAMAISFRQYTIVFPAALTVHSLLARRFDRALLAAAGGAALIAWFVVFDGVGPKPGVDRWVPYYPDAIVEPLEFIPEYGLFFLACMGIYFVVPEFVLFRRRVDWRSHLNRRNLVIALALLVPWLLFPPTFTDDEPGGMFGRLARFLMPDDPVRLCALYGLALLTCVRFARLDLPFLILAFQVLMMLKAQLAWEKYGLPILVALWYLKAIHALDGGAFPRLERRSPGLAARDPAAA